MHHNGTQGLALPEREERAALTRDNLARQRAMAAGAFKLEVQRGASAIAAGLVSRTNVSLEGRTEVEDLAQDAVNLAREIAIRALVVSPPTDAELDALRPSS